MTNNLMEGLDSKLSAQVHAAAPIGLDGRLLADNLQILPTDNGGQLVIFTRSVPEPSADRHEDPFIYSHFIRLVGEGLAPILQSPPQFNRPSTSLAYGP